ncbi:MAG: twin-arginine translocase subunit TatC [Burkholderiaceae bacterium]|nr:twin-arginine translocase subunit TatC [Burkholderiaceae bacterium]
MSTNTPDTDDLAGTEQTFVQHLLELRNRLVYAFIGLLVCMAALAIWPGPATLIDWIAIPIQAHMPPGAKLIAVGVFSPFFIPLKVLMMAAFLLALPWIMYQVWAFIAPGLYSHEKRFAVPLIMFGSLLAYGGIAFVQLLVLDKMFGFIQAFAPPSVAATPDIASYVEAILSLYLAFGLAFQVPIVVMLLVRFGLVTIEQLKSFRGYFIVLAFVIAAMVTPPDVISQLSLAVPMCILYECGIIGARWFGKASKPSEDAESSASDDTSNDASPKP